ncbi:MAG: hypothetical protein AAFV43_03465 [Planctomycetota bacterium]
MRIVLQGLRRLVDLIWTPVWQPAPTVAPTDWPLRGRAVRPLPMAAHNARSDDPRWAAWMAAIDGDDHDDGNDPGIDRWADDGGFML